MTSFPCTRCGACCRHVDLSVLTKSLDRGDGICRHHNLNTHLCEIYENRPEACRVDLSYALYFKQQMSWEDFIQLNLIACKQLEQLD